MTLAAVWGASGFAGMQLCDAASSVGWRLRRFQRSGGPDAIPLEFSAGEEEMEAALRGADIAFHCAGKAGDNSVEGYADAAGRFARACGRAGVRRLVYLSTVSVYGSPRGGEYGPESPTMGRGSYAQSRIEAESKILLAARGEQNEARGVIVRVPMLVGVGMPGTLLARVFRIFRTGMFPHPGRRDSLIAFLGIRRLSSMLVSLPESTPPIIQFSDHIRWTDLAHRWSDLTGRRVIRIRLPNPGGRFMVFDSVSRYRDDSSILFAQNAPVPGTVEDLDAVIRA